MSEVPSSLGLPACETGASEAQTDRNAKRADSAGTDFPVLTVVFDTTVIRSDWLLEGPAGSFVVAEAAAGRLRLVVPELVLREAVNLYRREFKAAAKALQTAVRDFGRLAADDVGAQLRGVLADRDGEEATAEYEKRLRDVFEKADGIVAPLPRASHDELITRALAGRRPFDQHGRRGYRDALIWHTVLEVASRHGHVVFISDNASDFAASRSEPNALAGNLLDEVAAMRDADHPDAKVDLRARPTVFVEMDCAPEELAAIAFRQRLKKERSFRLRGAEQPDAAWPTSWPDWEVEGDIGVEWEDSDLDLVGDVRDFDVDFVTAADDEGLFVQLSGHADVQVAYTIRGSSTWLDNPPEILDEIDWDEQTDTGRYTDVVPAALTFEANYRPGAPELRRVTLATIREFWDGVEPGRVLGGPIDRDAR